MSRAFNGQHDIVQRIAESGMNNTNHGPFDQGSVANPHLAWARLEHIYSHFGAQYSAPHVNQEHNSIRAGDGQDGVTNLFG
jgi:hypothetical protein